MNGNFSNNSFSGTIVDVRTPEEFASGCVEGSLNIPLQALPARVDEFKEMKSPLILCCASGNRSGQAKAYLKSMGIECENGGSWLEVRYNLLKESSGCCQ